MTKILVQKIKQDHGNNTKIGQILKTYGVSKVGELDPKKYEAYGLHHMSRILLEDGLIEEECDERQSTGSKDRTL